MPARKTYFRVVFGVCTLAVVLLAAVNAYDRDAVKAVPLVGKLPWHVVLGNTALHAEDRPVDYFTPEVAQAEKQQPDLLFLGDSLSRCWQQEGKTAWKQYFARQNALTLGVGGDRTQHFLYRLRSGAFDQLKPRTIVLQIGTNNINRNTPEEIAAAIETITGEMGEKWPNARLLVVAIPPRELPRSKDVIDRVDCTNRLLSNTLCGQRNVVFVDDANCFIGPDGWIDSALFSEEGIHFSRQGYAVLAKLIASALSSANL